MANSNVHYIFSSVYRFSHEGAKNIEEEFESTPEGRDALCRYDASINQFTIQCSRNGGDEVFSTFIAIVKNYIEVERKRNEDDDQGELVRRVERIPETVPTDPEYPEFESSNHWEEVSRGPTQQTSDEPPIDLISVWSDEKTEANNGGHGETVSAIFGVEQDSQLIGNLHNKTVTRKWKPSHWTQSISSLLCSEIVAKVTKLTRCRIQPSHEQRSILLTGEADEDVERAISKLVVLLEATYCRDVGVLFFDFPIAEKDVDTRLQFIPLKKDTRRLRTTLLCLDSPHIAVLPDLLVLVLLKRDVDYKFVVIPDQKRKRLQSLKTHCRIWPPEYEYKPHGHEQLMLTNSTLASISSEGDRSTIHEHMPPSRAALVERWREEVTPPSVHGSHTTATNTQLEFEGGRDSSAKESANTFTKPATPHKRTYGLKRVPKGMPVPESTEQATHHSELSSVAASSENIPLRSIMADHKGGSHSLSTTAAAASVSLSQHDWFAAVEGTQAFRDRDTSPNARLSGTLDLPRNLKASNDITLTSPQSIASITLVRGNITPAGPPVLGSSAQLPTRSIGGSEQEDGSAQSEISTPPWRTRVMQSERTGDLVNFSDARPRSSNLQSRMPVQARNAIRRSDIRRPVIQRTEDSSSGKAARERLQATNEVVSRTAKHTMNQQKLASGDVAAKGDAAVTKGFEAAAANVLKLARSCNGIVTLEVDIGRVLVRPQDVNQDYRRGLFTTDEWSSVFPSGLEAGFRETLFSNMITTTWVDAEFILDLKFPSGRRMFDETPHRVRAVYEFVCSSRLSTDGSQVIVEVQDDGNYQVRSRPKVLGALNYHFPKRMWDARLALTTVTLITDESFGFPAGGMIDEMTSEGRLLKAAKAIVDNLYVPPGKKVLELYTKTVNKDKTPNKDLKIEAVLLRRESCHRSTVNVHSNLCLTESQDLVIQRPTDRKYSVHAFALYPEAMVKKQRLWWTASLSSDEAKATFKENIDLELGELAVWTPENLVDGGVIRNLSELAHEVVTRIDNVGYGNKGLHAGANKQETVVGTVAASTAGAGAAAAFW